MSSVQLSLKSLAHPIITVKQLESKILFTSQSQKRSRRRGAELQQVSRTQPVRQKSINLKTQLGKNLKFFFSRDLNSRLAGNSLDLERK